MIFLTPLHTRNGEVVDEHVTVAGISVADAMIWRAYCHPRKLHHPDDVVTALNVDPDTAAKRAGSMGKRWLASTGPPRTVHRCTRRRDESVKLDRRRARRRQRVWPPCYFSGWTSANYWGLMSKSFARR